MTTANDYYIVNSQLETSGPFTHAQAWDTYTTNNGAETGDLIVVRAATPSKAITKVRALF